MKLKNLFIIFILSICLINDANSELYKYSASKVQTISQSLNTAENMRSFFWYDRLTLASLNGWRSYNVDRLSYIGDLVSGKFYDVIPGKYKQFVFAPSHNNAFKLFSCLENNPYDLKYEGELFDRNYIYRGVRARLDTIVTLDTYGKVNVRYEPIDNTNSSDYWIDSIYRFEDQQEYKGGDIVSITNYLRAIVAVARKNKMVTIEVDPEYNAFGGNHKISTPISLDGDVIQMEVFRGTLYVLFTNGKLSIFDISNNTPVFQKTIQVSQSSANCMKVYSFQWGNYLQIGADNNYLLYSLANSLFSPEKLYFESDNLRQSQIASIACNGNNVYLLNSEAVTAFSLNRELIQDITSDNLNISVQAGESNTKQIDISGGVPPYTLSISKQPAKGSASINNLSVRYHSDINDSGTVSLTVLIKDSANQTKEINVAFSIIPCPEPEAQFTFVPNTGYVPLQITFTDTSNPGANQSTSSREWKIMNGATILQNSTNTIHKYTFKNAGTYTVSLNIKNSCNKTDLISKTIQIKQCPDAIANYSASPDSGYAPLTVNFTDASTPGVDQSIISCVWNFGDNQELINQTNPSHTFSNPGKYDVILKVKNACGNQAEKTISITVSKFCPEPVAHFIYSPDNGHPPLRVQFTDQSTPGLGETIVERMWDFGDGTTSTNKNPLHIYETEGTFKVTLTIKNSCGKEKIKEGPNAITVTLPKFGIVNFNTNTLRVYEHQSHAQIKISRLDGNDGSISVDYVCQSDSAEIHQDFEPVSGTLQWNDGDSSTKTISVPIINDTIDEWSESFTVNLENLIGEATIGDNHTIQVIIKDNEYEPWIVSNGGEVLKNDAYILHPIIGESFVQSHMENDDFHSSAGFIFQEILESNIHINISDAEGLPGQKNISIPISLDNQTDLSTPVSSLECHIQYNSSDGIHPIEKIHLLPRTQGFTGNILIKENAANSEMIILLYSLGGEEIVPGLGAIFNLMIDVDIAAFGHSSSQLKFSKCMASDAQTNPIDIDHSDVGVFKILSFENGNIDADPGINILDVQFVLNVILNREQRPAIIQRADSNKDCRVDVLDLQCLINRIIGAECTLINNCGSQNRRLKANDSTANVISFPHKRLFQHKKGTIGLSLQNRDDVASGQFRLTYDSGIGLNISNVNTTHRTADLKTTFTQTNIDGRLNEVLVLFYSLDGSNINAGQGNILEFEYTTNEKTGKTEIIFTEIILADTSATSLPLHAVNGSVDIQQTKFLNDVILLLKLLSGMDLTDIDAERLQVLNTNNSTPDLSSLILILKDISFQ